MVPHRPDRSRSPGCSGSRWSCWSSSRSPSSCRARWGRVLAVAGGVLLTATVVLTGLDLGFYEAFDRPFNPLTDPGLRRLRARPGPPLRRPAAARSLAVGGVALGVAAALALCVWAAAATPARRAARAPGLWSRAVVALTVVWVVAGVGGAQVGRRTGRLVAGGLAGAARRSTQVRAELHDRQVFQHALTHDAYALHPGRAAAARAARQGRDAGLRRELRPGRRRRVVVRPDGRPHPERGHRPAVARWGSARAAAGCARRPSAGSAGWPTRPCRPGSGSTPSSATTRCSSSDRFNLVAGVRPGRLAHRQRHPLRRRPVGRGQALLRLRPDVRLARRRLRRPSLQLCADPRPVHVPRLRPPRARPARPQAR